MNRPYSSNKYSTSVVSPVVEHWPKREGVKRMAEYIYALLKRFISIYFCIISAFLQMITRLCPSDASVVTNHCQCNRMSDRNSVSISM